MKINMMKTKNYYAYLTVIVLTFMIAAFILVFVSYASAQTAFQTFPGVTTTAQATTPPPPPAPIRHTLAIAKEGNGTGDVTDPVVINCGPNCSLSIAEGYTTTLTATPGPNSAFFGWAGA